MGGELRLGLKGAGSKIPMITGSGPEVQGPLSSLYILVVRAAVGHVFGFS
jgi:hypothetical protein